MDKITKNDIAKYQVIVNDSSFSFDTNSLTIVLAWGLMGESVTINKEDLLHDEDGNYYFFIDTAEMYGLVTAACTFGIDDTDVEDGEWLRTDRRHLFRVVDMSCCGEACDCDCADQDDGLVSYVAYNSVANAHTVLMDADGNVIADVDNNLLEVDNS